MQEASPNILEEIIGNEDNNERWLIWCPTGGSEPNKYVRKLLL